MQRDEDSIYDIVLACRDIAQFIGILTAEQFAAEKLIRSAVLHQLTVIGEATKRLSESFRRTHSGIPWKQVAGLRDRLIHAYDDIDYTVVWHVATSDVPALQSYLEQLLTQQDGSA